MELEEYMFEDVKYIRPKDYESNPLFDHCVGSNTKSCTVSMYDDYVRSLIMHHGVTLITIADNT